MYTLHYHPLSSYCWKVLVGLYEAGVAFEKRFVDLGDPAQRDALIALWPLGKFPLLVDEARARSVPESTIILEYAAPSLIPADPERALAHRAIDRFYDLHVHDPMQRIVGDRLRPVDARDPIGVARARATIRTAYAIAEAQLAQAGGDGWACGGSFGLADCAAAPALHYANEVEPIGLAHPQVASYLARLRARPAFARVLDEAAPYLAMFPR
jgi:glutathione S-transferase